MAAFNQIIFDFVCLILLLLSLPFTNTPLPLLRLKPYHIQISKRTWTCLAQHHFSNAILAITVLPWTLKNSWHSPLENKIRSKDKPILLRNLIENMEFVNFCSEYHLFGSIRKGTKVTNYTTTETDKVKLHCRLASYQLTIWVTP